MQKLTPFLRIQLWLCMIFLPSILNSQSLRFVDEVPSPAVENNVYKTAAFNNPPSSPVRTIGEWEELQGLMIAWKNSGSFYPTMLKQIVKSAKQECKVYILTDNVSYVVNYLNNTANGGSVDTTNVVFLNNIQFNSVWCRDYGPWSVYTNDVDSLLTIDWIYNRISRPLDNAVPLNFGNFIGTPVYQNTTAPWDFVNTGGNFMTDGFGTAFASELVVEENGPGNNFGVLHTPAELDTIVKAFMGITKYIKMPTLPYDAIHHIDMHMKLLDEQTLLIGEYPQGVADGPQIEANLQYILSNFNSCFGTPYKVIRIPMPDDNGAYPNTTGDYFTYTNSSFVNNTIIVPTYNIPEDAQALQIYRDALPGYNVVGINSTASIGALGALHCITKEIGTSDPLLISHQKLEDTFDTLNGYTVNALMKHRSGISAATLFFRTDTTQPYTSVVMNYTGANDIWTANIPAQTVGAKVYYYVGATSNSGKSQVRPMPAPLGYWRFTVLGLASLAEHQNNSMEVLPLFPNPSKGITCLPYKFYQSGNFKCWVTDITGNITATIYEGKISNGERKFFINTESFSAGVYFVHSLTNDAMQTQKLVVK